MAREHKQQQYDSVVGIAHCETSLVMRALGEYSLIRNEPTKARKD
jgi:hypothetical protein